MTREKAKKATELLKEIDDLETLVNDIKGKGYIGVYASSLGKRFYVDDDIYIFIFNSIKDRLASLKEEFDAL